MVIELVFLVSWDNNNGGVIGGMNSSVLVVVCGIKCII